MSPHHIYVGHIVTHERPYVLLDTHHLCALPRLGLHSDSLSLACPAPQVTCCMSSVHDPTLTMWNPSWLSECATTPWLPIHDVALPRMRRWRDPWRCGWQAHGHVQRHRRGHGVGVLTQCACLRASAPTGRAAVASTSLSGGRIPTPPPSSILAPRLGHIGPWVSVWCSLEATGCLSTRCLQLPVLGIDDVRLAVGLCPPSRCAALPYGILKPRHGCLQALLCYKHFCKVHQDIRVDGHGSPDGLQCLGTLHGSWVRRPARSPQDHLLHLSQKTA
jgi:hypothetical protein